MFRSSFPITGSLKTRLRATKFLEAMTITIFLYQTILHSNKITSKTSQKRTCAYQDVRNVCFSENLACFVFLKHPF